MGEAKLIVLAVALVSGIVMGASTYGLGKEANNKSGSKYKAATAFTIISTIALFLSLLILEFMPSMM